MTQAMLCIRDSPTPIEFSMWSLLRDLNSEHAIHSDWSHVCKDLSLSTKAESWLCVASVHISSCSRTLVIVQFRATCVQQRICVAKLYNQWRMIDSIFETHCSVLEETVAILPTLSCLNIHHPAWPPLRNNSSRFVVTSFKKCVISACRL